MKIHEYQAKVLFRKYNVAVPDGFAVETVEAALDGYEKLGGGTVVVKSQIHAGGRGKGTIHCPNSGDKLMEGGVHLAHSKEEVKKFAKTMLNHILITHQTGPEGKEVQKLLIESGVDIQRELYAGIVLDRVERKFVFMVSTEGGMDIETVASETPEKIVKEWIEPETGLTNDQAIALAKVLELEGEQIESAVQIFSALWAAFSENDCSLMEINPLVVTGANTVMALDAKINIDDNGLFRHADLKELYDPNEEDPAEVEALKFHLNYIKLDGNVGCMVNGAGLAMGTMDIIKLFGGEPANFLDVGGVANPETVSNGFKIILSDPNVKSILINIFGGIVRCDRVAKGVIEAMETENVTVPVVVRLEGTNSKEASQLLNDASFDFIVASSLGDAAEKAVKATGVSS